jgi:tetratricopeptide (TPR) repeat protein
LADYGAALELAPDRADIYVDSGVALFRGKRPLEAVAEFTHALSLTPATPERVYFDRAMAREDSGDLGGAYADYRQAAALNPAWDAPARELTRFRVVPARPVS